MCFVPLEKNIDNIFVPFYNHTNDFCCEICNDLAGNPHQHLAIGAVHKTETMSVSKYILVKLGRVVLNYGKISYNVTLHKNNTVLDQNFKFILWVEYITISIMSGNYYLLRTLEQRCFKISDDNNLSFHNKNYT